MWGMARGAVEVGQAIGTEKALERGHSVGQAKGTGNMVIQAEPNRLSRGASRSVNRYLMVSKKF